MNPRALVGIGILVMLAAMIAGWAIRRLLMKRLRDRHPDEFTALGEPTSRKLASLLPRHQGVQVAFWRYLWNGNAFRLNDGLACGLAWAAIACDAAFAIGTVVLLASAAAAG